MSAPVDPDQIRTVWLQRLSGLIEAIESWSGGLGWVTRRIEISLNDSQLGKYKAPALRIQKDTTQVLVEPISHSAPGADGVVDLYLMPGYDDIASLYFRQGVWHIHYMYPGSPEVATIGDTEAKPLARESLAEVLEEMRRHAV